jgi:hypothetical protein
MINIKKLKHLFKCKWIIDERPSKEGDFKSGWSPVYFYEKCEICGKERNNSPFSKDLTLQIESLRIKGLKFREQLGGKNDN